MSQPPWPGPPGYPPPGYPPPANAAARSGLGTTVTVATVVLAVMLWIVAVLGAAAGAWLSLFFAMSTDTCHATCGPTPYDDQVYPTTFGWIGGGLAVGLIGSIVMVFFTRRWLWIWPVVSIVCTLVGFLSGLDLTVKSTEWTG
ncbi:hypothetical protein [Mycolicibacterium neworleansense]|uniref:Transmembrane protein n=1 Tax=Mycolicibacterium neworleansense TaxID=146018 RepID=A0A0H5RU28_9MYCO|nr:hypothetical protein [Mycolicibacterium neworleansense]MCV7361685.1 hypothetical protein [Mycolicibacterium neworleansense]CRZ17042.1 hypothetical protein BN2156_03921 [Mycolicibacterium neworleansense]